VQGGVCATCIVYKPLPATTPPNTPLPKEGIIAYGNKKTFLPRLIRQF
jgi:hypothetical protein